MLPLVAALGLTACDDAKAPSVELKPLEERRAHAIIERVVNDNGGHARPGRDLNLGGWTLHEDAVVGDGPYGVAYVTAEEVRDSKGQIPPYEPERQELRLVRPGDAIVLILYAEAYRYDVGEEHSATIVTAEKKMERDISDFIIHGVKMGKGK
jgi:hypothetical protein